MAMNIDPGKIVAEVAGAWKSSPFIIGSQLMIIGLLAFFAWDRMETRRVVINFVTNVMHEQDVRNQAMVERLNVLTETIVRCYEFQRDEGGPLLQSRPGDGDQRGRPGDDRAHRGP